MIVVDLVTGYHSSNSAIAANLVCFYLHCQILLCMCMHVVCTILYLANDETALAINLPLFKSVRLHQLAYKVHPPVAAEV